MAVNVRIFGYRGLAQLAEAQRSKFENNIQPLRLTEPYEWSQVLAAPSGTSIASTPVRPDLSTLLKIEVPDGQIIQYDINRAVNSNSPWLTGIQVIQWNVGWTLSVSLAFTVVPIVFLVDDNSISPGAILTDDNTGALLTPP